MSDFTEYPPEKPILLRNQNCIYCLRPFVSEQDKTKEHVIGRRFVPKGTLQGGWNLIAWACKDCNARKAELEDDISAISMHPDTAGRFASEDIRLRTDAQRKAEGANSRRTGKRVKDSVENLTIEAPFAPGVKFTFNVVAAPQADGQRLANLAKFHVQAFFYLITYKQESQTGFYFPGIFVSVMEAKRADWGNARMRGFMELTRDWEHRVLAGGAEGFFKLCIRRLTGVDVWSWAVEWNQSFRLIGFLGAEEEVMKVANGLPKLQVQQMVERPGSEVRFRLEEPLDEADDSLFAYPSENVPNAGPEPAHP